MEFTPKQKNVIEDLTGRVPILLKVLLDIDLSLPDVLPQGGLTEVSDSTSEDSQDASRGSEGTSGGSEGTSNDENEETQLPKWQKVCDHLWASHEVRNLVVRLMSFARASREKYLDTENMKM
jgi:hypothetical protein